jgi:hypothetical protein
VREDERRTTLSSHQKDADQKDKLATAPLPQKNAVSRPASEASKHREHLRDEALEETFPASDPASESPVEFADELSEDERHEECLLDEALEETFPASDPIAVYGPDKVGKTSGGTAVRR